ncbi:MAG: hypothetical protein J5614_01335 [Paludibacteraceae bacterium]|nr:hypothetical protein [Paludibacteraceae bacterium]
MPSSNDSSQSINEDINEYIKNININDIENDNYITNTVNSAMTTTVNMAVNITNALDSTNEDSVINLVKSKMNVIMEHVYVGKGASVVIDQEATATQYATLTAIVQTISEQRSDVSSIAIALDMLNISQGLDSMSDTAAQIANSSDISASQGASVSSSQSAESKGFTTSSNDSDQSISLNTTIDVYNINNNTVKNDTTAQNIANYITQVKDNLTSNNNYTQNINNVFESINMMENGMNVIIGSLYVDEGGTFIARQSFSQIQESKSEIFQFYNNFMCDMVYHYLENNMVSSDEQTASASNTTDLSSSSSNVASASQSASGSSSQTAKSKDLVSSVVDSVTDMIGSIAGVIVAVIAVVMVVLGLGGLVFLFMFLKKKSGNKAPKIMDPATVRTNNTIGK